MSLSLVACCVFLLVSWIVSNVHLSLCPVFVLPRIVLFYSSSVVFPLMWLMKRARACALRIYQILPLFGAFLFSHKAKTHRTWARQGLLASSCIQKHIFNCVVCCKFILDLFTDPSFFMWLVWYTFKFPSSILFIPCLYVSNFSCHSFKKGPFLLSFPFPLKQGMHFIHSHSFHNHCFINFGYMIYVYLEVMY